MDITKLDGSKTMEVICMAMEKTSKLMIMKMDFLKMVLKKMKLIAMKSKILSTTKSILTIS